MYKHFPAPLLSLLRCPRDQGALKLGDRSIQTDRGIQTGRLRCAGCDAVYPIEEGIARIFSQAALDEESRRELAIRDQRADISDPHEESSAWHRMEIEPTLEALGPLAGTNVLELGCGTGRLTVRLAQAGANVLATDFSPASLRFLAGRIRSEWRIGLVHADCTHFAVQKRSFGRVLSTLVSNLPTARHRAAMMQLAADAIGNTGRFVFSTHHYGLRERLRGESMSGHYPDTGIYRLLFRRRDILRETSPYFRDVRCRPIRVQIPLLGRLGFPVVAFSRLAEKIPLLDSLGDLLLLVAREPL